MSGYRGTELDGIGCHLDAIAAGEKVEDRIQLIHASNWLTDDVKWRWQNFLKSFCLYAALEPYCASVIDLGGGVSLRLNSPRVLLEGNELPGARVDSMGDLVIEGHFYRRGASGLRFSRDNNDPLWPLIIRDAPVYGAGPWENFKGQAFKLLSQIGNDWPMAAGV